MLRSGLKSSLNSARSSVIRANHLLPASRPTLSLSAQHSPASWQVGMQQQQQRFRSQLAPRRTKYRKAHKGRVAVSTTRRVPQYNVPESSRTFSLVLFSRLSFFTHPTASYGRVYQRDHPPAGDIRSPSPLLGPSHGETTLFRRSRRQTKDQGRQGGRVLDARLPRRTRLRQGE